MRTIIQATLLSIGAVCLNALADYDLDLDPCGSRDLLSFGLFVSQDAADIFIAESQESADTEAEDAASMVKFRRPHSSPVER